MISPQTFNHLSSFTFLLLIFYPEMNKSARFSWITARKRQCSVWDSSKEKQVSTREMFGAINQHSAIFENKSFQAFAKWRSTEKTLFLQVLEKKNASNCRRGLYVLKDTHRGNIMMQSWNIGLSPLLFCRFDVNVHSWIFNQLPAMFRNTAKQKCRNCRLYKEVIVYCRHRVKSKITEANNQQFTINCNRDYQLGTTRVYELPL